MTEIQTVQRSIEGYFGLWLSNCFILIKLIERIKANKDEALLKETYNLLEMKEKKTVQFSEDKKNQISESESTMHIPSCCAVVASVSITVNSVGIHIVG